MLHALGCVLRFFMFWIVHGAPVKVCSCGRCYSWASFADLPYCGVMGSRTRAAELRHCTCGSTIAITIPRCAL